MDDRSSIAAEVEEAAGRLVAAYSAHQTDDYFACFHPDATFIFHTSPERITSRDGFRQEWDTWVRDDGFRVLDCSSSEQMIQVFGGVAVFAHNVRTRARAAGEEETTFERETIVFARQDDGTWLAVHEHLSPDPNAPTAE